MRIALIAVLALSLPASAMAACGMDNVQKMPAVSTIDDHLKNARLSAAGIDQVKALREKVAGFIAAGDVKQARSAEADAMQVLGYERLWLRCGIGSFVWAPRKAK